MPANLRRALLLLPAAILLAALWVALSPAAWQLHGDRLLAASPAGATPHLLPQQADLDGNGSPECLSLRQRRLSILDCAGGETQWQSPAGWRVWQAGVGDLNRDGQPEAVLLVWRPFQPWSVDRVMPHGGRIDSHQNFWRQSCHVILIGFGGGRWRELWAGSALARPLLAFAAADLDGDGWQELAVLETDYRLLQVPPAAGLAVWEWNGFGFDLVTRRPGVYFDLRVLQADGSYLLETH
ncbi:MAG: VCBS repeat-containing protein [Anaerolineae bacterium]|nr:VCBS repeat-containing protein [Anaerolineae bacterium]